MATSIFQASIDLSIICWLRTTLSWKKDNATSSFLSLSKRFVSYMLIWTSRMLNQFWIQALTFLFVFLGGVGRKTSPLEILLFNGAQSSDYLENETNRINWTKRNACCICLRLITWKMRANRINWTKRNACCICLRLKIFATFVHFTKYCEDHS